MKLAVIGDIHANHTALKRCLEWIYENSFDGMIFLGDYVTDCPYPQKTVDILRSIPKEYRTWFIRGNRDDYLLEYRKCPCGWKYGSKTGNLLYTYENLSPEALDWLANMPQETVVEIDGYPSIQAMHRPSYHTFLQKQPPVELLAKTISEMAQPVLVCAHSHVPLVYQHADKLIVNSGPLGIMNEGITDARFAVLEYKDRWHGSIVSLPYDIEAACAEFEPSGILAKAGIWAIAVRQMLRTGFEYSVECLDELHRLLELYPDKTEYDEDMWTLAANNIGLDISK